MTKHTNLNTTQRRRILCKQLFSVDHLLDHLLRQCRFPFSLHTICKKRPKTLLGMTSLNKFLPKISRFQLPKFLLVVKCCEDEGSPRKEFFKNHLLGAIPIPLEGSSPTIYAEASSNVYNMIISWPASLLTITSCKMSVNRSCTSRLG